MLQIRLGAHLQPLRNPWCFDPEWGPQLLKNFDGFELTRSGEFFKQSPHRAPVPVEPHPAPKW